jgi:hypothetical protein
MPADPIDRLRAAAPMVLAAAIFAAMVAIAIRETI